MKRHMLQYLILWVPIAVVTYFFQGHGMVSVALQWVFAVVMVVGWGVNTGMAAYRYPRTTLSFLLFYTGINILIIAVLYQAADPAAIGLLRRWGGLFSYSVLDILLQALLDFNIMQEVYVLGIIVAACLCGYAAGLVYRRVRPNPYHPQIMKGKPK